MSNPALKAVSRIQLQRVATPAPRTFGRADALLYALADTDARIGCAYRLLKNDADDMGRLDRPAFVARARAVLFDLELATQLVTALTPLKPQDEWLRSRARSIVDQRRAIEALIHKAEQ